MGELPRYEPAAWAHNIADARATWSGETNRPVRFYAETIANKCASNAAENYLEVRKFFGTVRALET
jgi:hypothetical protein